MWGNIALQIRKGIDYYGYRECWVSGWIVSHWERSQDWSGKTNLVAVVASWAEETLGDIKQKLQKPNYCLITSNNSCLRTESWTNSKKRKPIKEREWKSIVCKWKGKSYNSKIKKKQKTN